MPAWSNGEAGQKVIHQILVEARCLWQAVLIYFIIK